MRAICARKAAYLLSMRLLGLVSEDEVISAFLRAEIDSDRYGEKLRRLLARNRQGGFDDRAQCYGCHGDLWK